MAACALSIPVPVRRRCTGGWTKKARAIVDWRDSNGPFKNVDELTSVHGIGPKTLEGLRQYVFADGKGEPAGD
jgi:competence ComEA-like helix-hairpin-helix protein